ncbi:hypothetical protein RB653_001092 [Dictyostelium firmibasis]|uniref:Gluconokinase n=1 Tax=Dictyostelium firmibasis TaxID=79012 RepID=A0AAN7TWC4_9MYCE
MTDNNNSLNDEIKNKLEKQQKQKDQKLILVIMGVSGSGKTTIGKAIASSLGCGFNDADEFHSEENKEKMRSGIPLNDDDRKPWLASINKRMIEFLNDESVADCCSDHVFTCSALKSIYRDQLSNGINKDNILFIFLQGTKQLLSERLQSRKDHFFNPTLLDSQLSTLELPTQLELSNHHYAFIDISNSIDDIIDEIFNYLK